MGNRVGVTHLVMGHPSCLTLSYLSLPLPLCPLPPLPETTCPPGRRSFAVGRCSAAVHEQGLDWQCPVLAEFQTPTIFDCNFYFSCSSVYSSPKIVKIIIYILYIHKNAVAISIWKIPVCGFGYVVILFQSSRIYFYIEIPRRFCVLLIYTTKSSLTVSKYRSHDIWWKS